MCEFHSICLHCMCVLIWICDGCFVTVQTPKVTVRSCHHCRSVKQKTHFVPGLSSQSVSVLVTSPPERATCVRRLTRDRGIDFLLLIFFLFLCRFVALCFVLSSSTIHSPFFLTPTLFLSLSLSISCFLSILLVFVSQKSFCITFSVFLFVCVVFVWLIWNVPFLLYFFS